jgi:hypothetical protein
MNRIKSYQSVSLDKSSLKFYKFKIPEEDYEVLEQSFFLRAEYKEGRSIHKIKRDIRTKYGDRG